MDRHFTLIPPGPINILVPYDRAAYENLVQEASDLRFATPARTRSWMARASQASVSLHPPKPCDAIWNYLAPVKLADGRGNDPLWYICLDEADSRGKSIYDRELLGLRTDVEFNGII